MGWQDISSAPMDGTRFLATNGEVVSVAYSNCDPRFAELLCENSVYGADRNCGYHDTWWPKATHWMPLPEAPE